MSEPKARYGWESDFPTFRSADHKHIRERLRAFVSDASTEQDRAWRDAIPPLQAEVDEILLKDRLAETYSAILEYELPMEARRSDVILLVGAGVMVLELKGKLAPSQADIDQAGAYARDLRCYHRDCEGREVVPVLVPTRARGYLGEDAGVLISGPDALDALVADLTRRHPRPQIDRGRFLEQEAYRPLPTLVEAARELFQTGDLRTIKRARAATDPAIDEISRIVHQAALTQSRHLVLMTGVPGAGKTLVGLRTVHARYPDDLAVPRPGGKPSTPAVFLSGNGPLVEVLQYELRSAGGGGKTFVRGVKDYVSRYSGRSDLVPPEHVLVFDEAQRAYDQEMMRQKHKDANLPSEPEQFISFADRIPEWSVVVGLIGTGQEIHLVRSHRRCEPAAVRAGVPDAEADEAGECALPVQGACGLKRPLASPDPLLPEDLQHGVRFRAATAHKYVKPHPAHGPSRRGRVLGGPGEAPRARIPGCCAGATLDPSRGAEHA